MLLPDSEPEGETGHPNAYCIPKSRTTGELSIAGQVICLLETMHLVLKQRERRLLQYSDEHLSRLFTLFEVNCAGKSALINFLSGQ